MAGLAAATYASNIQERNPSKQGLRHIGVLIVGKSPEAKILDQFTESFLLSSLQPELVAGAAERRHCAVESPSWLN